MHAIPQLFAHPEGAAKAFRSVIDDVVSGHTDRAYLAAANDFSLWCTARGFLGVDALSPEVAKAYVETSCASRAVATVRQRIVCLRMLLRACSDAGVAPVGVFDGITVSRRRTKWHEQSGIHEGKLRRMVAANGGSGVTKLRDRALLGVLYSAFMPVRSVCRLTVATFVCNPKGAWLVFVPGRYGFRVRCPDGLATSIDSYIRAAGIGMESEGYLFRSVAGASERVTERPLTQPDVYRIIQRLARNAGLTEHISPRQLRAAGIVRFLRDGGSLDVAKSIAGHATVRTTIAYAAPGTRRPRHRIAYRLADLAIDLGSELEDDLEDWNWDDDEDYE